MKRLKKTTQTLILRNDKGSLTVEAAVILPLFLCVFFLFLFMIKTACIQITLDAAVRGTTAEIAAGAYPLAFLNEMEDEFAGEQTVAPATHITGPTGSGTGDEIDPDAPVGFITGLISGGITESDLADALDSMAGIREYLFANYGGIYYELKDRGKYNTVRLILDKYIVGSYVEPAQLTVSLAEFPQSSSEYKTKKQGDYYRQTGLIPGQNFDQDDVVIRVDYKLVIPLPLFQDAAITLTHTAVEKAWLTGGNGVYTDRTDRSVFKGEQELVYITRTGEKYHRSDCRYLRKSRIPADLSMVRGRYDPCKVCKPEVIHSSTL